MGFPEQEKGLSDQAGQMLGTGLRWGQVVFAGLCRAESRQVPENCCCVCQNGSIFAWGRSGTSCRAVTAHALPCHTRLALAGMHTLPPVTCARGQWGNLGKYLWWLLPLWPWTVLPGAPLRYIPAGFSPVLARELQASSSQSWGIPLPGSGSLPRPCHMQTEAILGTWEQSRPYHHTAASLSLQGPYHFKHGSKPSPVTLW